MPNNTLNFNLPYPAGTDRPCDFAEQWCEFTTAVDAVFAVFQAAIDRTIPVIPMAILQQTTVRSILNSAPLIFDTVLVDTAAMTDIDVDPFSITIQRAGRYTVAAYVQKPTAGAPFVPAEWSIFIEPQSDAQGELIDRGAGVDYHLTAYKAVESHFTVGTKIRLSYSVGNQSSFNIDRSWLSVAWHSDTEVP